MRQMILIGYSIGQTGSGLIGMNGGHDMRHSRLVAEGDDGQVGVQGQVVPDELLRSLVHPLPLVVAVHGGRGLHDENVLGLGFTHLLMVKKTLLLAAHVAHGVASF